MTQVFYHNLYGMISCYGFLYGLTFKITLLSITHKSLQWLKKIIEIFYLFKNLLMT